MRYNIINIYITAVALLFCCSCADENLSPGGKGQESGMIISVGADITDAIATSATTRAAEQSKDAETVDWLVQPLMKGLDITYGNIGPNGTHNNSNVAILRLQPKGTESSSPYAYEIDRNSGYAKYSFNYRGVDGTETVNPALWYDNGYHFFEGVHVPYRLRYKENITELTTDNRDVYEEKDLAAVINLTTDQHNDAHTGTDNDLGNYTLLAHYLGMPANTRIAATVARIKLPFRHRLARVLAYILIDPELKTNGVAAKIKGYENIEQDESKPFRDDPTTSSIRFCNVDVLGGVHDVYNEEHQLHTLTPTWSEKVRKVVPHFEKQLTTFKTYQSDDNILYEGSSNFPTSQPANYKEVIYQNVPVYDLIVRPTYTNADNVMYDENRGGLTPQEYAAKTNKIDFTISLDNGLTYEKEFIFDLNANYQTIVYLRITREGVDYNESGSEKWVETYNNDKWYGVDNDNGNTLSNAGSSWQRAYYNRTLNALDEITDGGFYDENTAGEDGTKGQYVKTETWKEYFLQAFKGGKHHGDYFVLANDVTIDASLLPSDGIVFTGHLDGFNTHYEQAYHKITLQNAGQVMTCTETVTDYLAKLYEDNAAEHKVPQLYWMNEIAQAPGRRNIPMGEPIPFDMDKTEPKDLEGLAIFFKEDGEYRLYENRTFYKKTPGFLFAGLDGIYETNQERGQTPWEANVHKEGSYWLPYRDVTGANATNTGWRAEVLNLTVEGGTLFKAGAIITGNVENCKDASGKVADHRPAMPRYK